MALDLVWVLVVLVTIGLGFGGVDWCGWFRIWFGFVCLGWLTFCGLLERRFASWWLCGAVVDRF